MSNGQQKVEVMFPEGLRGGAYANNMLIGHTKEEFILDFIMIAPPAGAVTSRVIVSPGHLKRMINAMQDNMKKYEEKFGKISAAEEPKSNIGFRNPVNE